MCRTEITVGNVFSKYDNPLAQLVQIACEQKSTVHGEVDNKNVNLKSLMGIIALGLSEGMNLSIVAEGEDENEACTKLCNFLTCN